MCIRDRHEASREAGLGAELMATVIENCFEHLESAPVRVTGHDVPYPPARLEKHFLPDLDRVLDAIEVVTGRRDALTPDVMDLSERAGEMR